MPTLGELTLNSEVGGGVGGTTVGGNLTVVSGYASFAAALAAIGSTQKTLMLDVDATISAELAVPANITILPVNGARFVKSGSGALRFQGIGLYDPEREEVLFSGFSPGDITWAALPENTNLYPSAISSGLFANTTASARINMCDQAFLGKRVTINATVGHLAEQVVLNNGHNCYLQAGRWTNSNTDAAFRLWSDVWVQGAGIGVTIIEESTYDAAGNFGVRIFYANSCFNSLQNNEALFTDQNISVTDLTISTDGNIRLGRVEQSSSAIWLGNVWQGYIQRVHFYRCHGFSAYVGIHTQTNPSAGVGVFYDAYAKNCFIQDCIFEDGGTQSASSINSKGLTMTGNQFIDTGFYAYEYGQYANFIDCEPNIAGNHMEDVLIANNIFKADASNIFGLWPADYGAPNPTPEQLALRNTPFIKRQQLNVILVQSHSGVKNIKISDNIIIGMDFDSPNAPLQYISAGIAVTSGEHVQITNNMIAGTSRPGIYIYNSALCDIHGNVLTQCSTYSMLFSGVYDSIIRDNTLPKFLDYADGFGNGRGWRSHYFPISTIRESAWGQSVYVGHETIGGQQVCYAVFPGGEPQGGGYTNIHKDKTITIASGTPGVTGGDYRIMRVDQFTGRAYLEYDAGDSGNSTVYAVNDYCNNRYLNNVNGEYEVSDNSRSIFNDNTNGESVQTYQYFHAGDVDTAFEIADLNKNAKGFFRILSIEARCHPRDAPSGTITTPAKLRLTRSVYQNARPVIDLTLTSANNVIQGDWSHEYQTEGLNLRVETAQVGGVKIKNVNITVTFQMGVKVIRV